MKKSLFVLFGAAIVIALLLYWFASPDPRPTATTGASAPGASPSAVQSPSAPGAVAPTGQAASAPAAPRNRAEQILSEHLQRPPADPQWAERNQQKFDTYVKRLHDAGERDAALGAIAFKVLRFDCRKDSCLAEVGFPGGYSAAISLNGMIDELVVEQRTGVRLVLDCPKKRFVPTTSPNTLGPITMLMHFDCAAP